MITKIFTIFDSKAASYLPPMYMQSTGAMIRTFEDECNNEKSHFNKHPADFTLFEIGSFDDQTCEIVSLDVKIPLGTALEMKAETQQQMIQNNQKATMEAVK